MHVIDLELMRAAIELLLHHTPKPIPQYFVIPLLHRHF